VAVVPPPIIGAILSAGPGLKGPMFAQIATAVGIAVTSWVQTPGNVVLTGVSTGTAGVGTASGKFVLGVAPLPGTLPANTLVGPLALEISAAIGLGVTSSLNATAQFIGTSTGVGVGTLVNKTVAANPATLTGILIGALSAQGLVGPTSPVLAKSISDGIAALVMTGGGVGVVAGPPAPAPGGGVSVCKLV